MNNLLSDANDYGLGGADDHVAVANRAAVAATYQNFLAEVEDLIKDSTWLTGEELAHEQPAFTKRQVAARESLDAMGTAFAQRGKRQHPGAAA